MAMMPKDIDKKMTGLSTTLDWEEQIVALFPGLKELMTDYILGKRLTEQHSVELRELFENHGALSSFCDEVMGKDGRPKIRLNTGAILQVFDDSSDALMSFFQGLISGEDEVMDWLYLG